MAEGHQEAEILVKVTAAAARMERERKGRRNAPGGAAFTAAEMDRMSEELGIHPALVRLALGQIMAVREAQRRYVRQTQLAIAACVISLAAGVIFGYKLSLNARNLAPLPSRGEADEIAATPAATPPAAAPLTIAPGNRLPYQQGRIIVPQPAVVNPPQRPLPSASSTINAETEVRQQLEMENMGYATRDYRVLRTLYHTGYRMRTRQGKTFQHTAVMRSLQDLPRYSRDWRREATLQSLTVSGNRAIATQTISIRYTDSRGFVQNQRWQMACTWRRIGGQWLKYEDREL